jgi:peptidase M1-like protein
VVPRYVLSVHVHRGLRLVTGTLAVTFTPGIATDRLVFRLWPNEPFLAQKGAKLTVSAVRWRGKPVRLQRPDPTTLVVRRRLTAGAHAQVSMKWRLHLPVGSFDRLYGGSMARLGSFFPLLAWDPRSGWQTDPPSAIGWETWTSPAADFSVRVTAPRELRVLASGRQVGRGRWTARAVRDFALAVGRFTVATGTAAAPGKVRVMVGVEGRSRTFAQAVLADARAALEAHAQRFGPYPWPTYTVVASDMYRFSWEYPTLVFVSANAPDPAAGVAHETGHQWFYSLVGSNQARDPWLDETLATWAQVRFSNELAAELALPIPEGVRNQLGQPMSFWDQFAIPEFIAGAYDQGFQALASLGDPDMVDCALGLYVRDNAYRTAAPSDLLSALLAFFPNARQKLEAYGARF